MIVSGRTRVNIILIQAKRRTTESSGLAIRPSAQGGRRRRNEGAGRKNRRRGEGEGGREERREPGSKERQKRRRINEMW